MECAAAQREKSWDEPTDHWVCLAMVSRILFSFAPEKESTLAPFLKKTNVGMDWIWCSLVSSCKGRRFKSHFSSKYKHVVYLILVNIHLQNDQLVGQFLLQLFQNGGNHLARTTPGSIEVDKNKLVPRSGQLLLEVILNGTQTFENQSLTTCS